MPRYFFHVRSQGIAIDDRDGLNYFTFDSAVAYAKRLARNIGEDSRYCDFHVVLADDQELLRIVATMPVKTEPLG